MFESKSAINCVLSILFIFKENKKFIFEMQDAFFRDVKVRPVGLDVRLTNIWGQWTHAHAIQRHNRKILNIVKCFITLSYILICDRWKQMNDPFYVCKRSSFLFVLKV